MCAFFYTAQGFIPVDDPYTILEMCSRYRPVNVADSCCQERAAHEHSSDGYSSSQGSGTFAAVSSTFQFGGSTPSR